MREVLKSKLIIFLLAVGIPLTIWPSFGWYIPLTIFTLLLLLLASFGYDSFRRRNWKLDIYRDEERYCETCRSSQSHGMQAFMQDRHGKWIPKDSSWEAMMLHLDLMRPNYKIEATCQTCDTIHTVPEIERKRRKFDFKYPPPQR